MIRDEYMGRVRGLFIAFLLLPAFLVSTAGEDGRDALTAGSTLWVAFVPGHNVSSISDLSLADLDRDRDLEVFFLTDEGGIGILDHDGHPYQLQEPFMCSIRSPEDSGFYNSSYPTIDRFSSILNAELTGDYVDELVFGGPGGVYCVDIDGKLLWGPENRTDGHVFCTPSLVDLFGRRTGTDRSREIVYSKEKENRTTYLEGVNSTGSVLFSYPVCHNSSAVISSPAAEGLSGKYWDGPNMITPSINEDHRTEIMFSCADHPYMVKDITGTESDPSIDHLTRYNLQGNHYSTPAVGEIDGDPSLEIVAVANRIFYHGNDTSIVPEVTAWDSDGSLLWMRELPGVSSPVLTSPVIADLGGTWYKGQGTLTDIEVLVTTTNGGLFVLDGDSGNVEWSFDPGSQLRTDPCVADLDKDGGLEVILIDHGGTVYCLDGTPWDDHNDGIVHPQDGQYLDIIWTHDTYHPPGSISPVASDLDGDGVVEIIVASGNGYITCISGGGGGHFSGPEWPMFRGNRMRNGWYHYPTYYSFEVEQSNYMTAYEEPALKHGRPGGRVSFNFTVEDTTTSPLKGVDQKITMKAITPSRDGWEVTTGTPWSDSEENEITRELALKQRMVLTAYCHVPYQVNDGEIATITLKFTSDRMREVNRTFDVMVQVHINVDMDLYADVDENYDPSGIHHGHRMIHMDPMDSTVIDIVVRNRGDLDDTVTLMLNEPNPEWDWSFKTTGSREILMDIPHPVSENDPLSERRLKVVITSVSKTPEYNNIPVIVNMASRMRQDVIGPGSGLQDEVYIHVNDYYFLDLYSPERNLTGFPGDRVATSFSVHYEGNVNEVVVEYRLERSDDTWHLEYERGDIAIMDGQKRVVELFIHIPENAAFGSHLDVHIRAFIEGTTDIKYATIGLNVKLTTGYQIHRLGDEGPLELSVGQYKNADYRLQNLGNAQITVQFHPPEIPAGIEFDILVDGMSAERIIVEEGEYQLFSFAFLTGTDAFQGFHSMDIELLDQYGISRNITIDYHVKEWGSVQISVPGGRNEGAIGPGCVFQSGVYLKNEGNGQKTVSMMIGRTLHLDTVDMSDLDTGWSGGFSGISRSLFSTSTRKIPVYNEPVSVSNMGLQELLKFSTGFSFTGKGGDMVLTEITVIMEPGETVHLNISIRSPHYNGRTKVDPTSFYAVAYCRETGSHSKARFFLDVEYPDLAIASMSVLKSHGGSGGKYVEGTHGLFIMVANIGNVSCTSSEMKIEVNGIATDIFDIPPLGAGEHYNLTVNVEMPSGLVSIKVLLDLRNQVYESRDQYMNDGKENNNNKLLTLKVESKEDTSISINVVIFTVIILVVLVLVVLIAFQARKLKGLDVSLKLPRNRGTVEEDDMSVPENELKELESLMDRMGN